jgi:hypothetical protein
MKNFFDESLDNFLCFSTRFEDDERLTLEQTTNHYFLSNFDSSSYLKANIKSLSCLFKVFISADNQEMGKVYFSSILKNLCLYYQTGERWYILDNPLASTNAFNKKSKVLQKDSELLRFLAYEFGVSTDYLWEKVQQMINSNYKNYDP